MWLELLVKLAANAITLLMLGVVVLFILWWKNR
jgi:hypothetical protein